MFQLLGFAVMVILALYGALHLGILPADWAEKLPQDPIGQEMRANIEMPYATDRDPEELSFTERVTGQKNPSNNP